MRLRKVGWKECVLPAIAIMLLSLMPQIQFWLVRGSQWNGAYAVLFGDEFLYSTYINALIDGRPRRNDPFTGHDDHAQAPLPESVFSIQFVPSFALSIFARAFKLSASDTFIILAGLTGLLASFSVYWLLVCATSESRTAAVGMLVVLCFGASAAGHGIVGLLFRSDLTLLGLPFLRRYEPAAPFPLFFVFCALVWQGLTIGRERSSKIRTVLAGITLVLLIFSYFYLWTAALGWLICITLLWLFSRPHERRTATQVFIIILTLTIFALTYYLYLVSHLPPALDKAQVLTLTRRPDLLRVPEIIGALLLGGLIITARIKRKPFSDPRMLLAASFALLPFVVFNQQVITGRSIQPYHYEVFIANYAVLIAFVLMLLFWFPSVSRRTLVLIATCCLLWGLIEVNITFVARSTLDVQNDEMIPVFARLKQLASNDGTWEGLRKTGKSAASVFSPDTGIARLLPTWAPQGSTLAMGSISFQSLSFEERRQRLFMHLYYCGNTEDDLRKLLNDKGEDPFLRYYSLSTLFGPERMSQLLAHTFQPITPEEIEHVVSEYDRFVRSFSFALAAQHPLTYAVVRAKSQFNFSNIDLWYERDAAENAGLYDLYRLRLRVPVITSAGLQRLSK